MQTNNKWLSWLKSFFINYLWLGVLLVCIAIILDLQYPQPNRHLALSSLILLLQAIGIAIIVASIFTFASGTSRFMSKIRGFLQDIIVSRSFLSNIDQRSKREALRAIIIPSIAEKKIYSNLEDYYSNCIDQTLSIAKKSVRSNYNVTCFVKYDPEKRRVIVRESTTYRIYPTEEGYEDINIYLTDYDESYPPICESLIISAPNGEHIYDEPIKLDIGEFAGEKCLSGKVELKVLGREKSHMDVESTWLMTEHDHWATIGFQAVKPTDGFRYYLVCEGDIKIRNVTVFTYGINVHIKREEKEIAISCAQWLHEGAGLSIVVSREIKV